MALRRAVDLGRASTLPMAELRAMCERAGFARVRSWIASGNAVFASGKSEAEVRAALEAQLLAFAGGPVGVLVRSAAEIAQVLARNPFPDALPARTVAIFLDRPPPADTLARLRHRTTEQVAFGTREIYVAHGGLIGRSRLAIPGAEGGTARNLNTVAQLARMSGDL